MRKSTRSLVLRVGCVVCVALAAVACSVLAAEEGAKPSADSILRDLARAHLGWNTYQATFVTHQGISIGAESHGFDTTLTVKAVRPDRIYVQAELGGQKLRLVSNGRELALYLDVTNRYALGPGPDSLDVVLAHPVLEQLLLTMAGVTLGPLGDAPYEALSAGVTASEVVPPSKDDPPGTDHVLLRRGQGDMHLWIGRDPRRLVRAELDPQFLLAAMKAQNPEMKDARVVARVDQKDVTTGAEIPDDTFNFKPPEGAERVQDWRKVFMMSQVGKPMSDFTLDGLKEGATWHLADHKGKVIVLDFWATWCDFCREELPQLQKVWDDYGKKGDFLLLGVNVAEPKDTVAAFVEQMKLTIPVALDAEAQVTVTYNGPEPNLPTVVLIGRDGRIRKVYEGPAPGGEQALRAEIDRLLAEKPAEGK
jgi:peroxiredoxin/outer membrane lipoprotein-sorting protein